MQDMQAKDIMTRKPLTVSADTPLIDAARIMFEKNFNGIPVVDAGNKLIGLLTQQDLILHTNSIHLPTLIKLLSEIKVYKKDSSLVKDDLKKLLHLTVAGVMNHEPLTVDEGTPVDKVAEVFASHHAINPIPVVDTTGHLAGIVSRYDILKFFVGPSWNKASAPSTPHDQVDIQVNSFINEFESRFFLVSKSRTRLWLWLAIAFTIVGFSVAWFLILRVNQQSY